MTIPTLDCRRNWRLIDELLEQETLVVTHPQKEMMVDLDNHPHLVEVEAAEEALVVPVAMEVVV